jgi:hypothetical protein
VGLVGVAGFDGGLRQVAASPRCVHRADEALEAVDALQRLGPVADRVVEPAAQLALAQVDVGGDLLDAGRRVAQQPCRVRYRQVGRSARDQRPRRLHDPLRGDGRTQSRRQRACGGGEHVGQLSAQVTDLAQRQAESGSAGRRAEPDARHNRAGRAGGAHRSGVRAGDVRAPALLPDEVAAPVGQY